MGTGSRLTLGTARARLDGIHAELATVGAQLWLIALPTLTIDVFLTYRGLRMGLTEGNPVMRATSDTMGFAALGLLKAPILGSAGSHRELRPEYGAVIPAGLAIPWFVAITVNASLVS